jgi:RNA polymerase sigma factor (sigma-70 family)
MQHAEARCRPGADAAPETFEEAYRRLRPAMVRLAHLLTGSLELAEDAVHDAFVAAGRRWASIETPDAYVRRAVANHARTALRAAGRERDKLGRAGRMAGAPAVTVGVPEIDETWEVLRLLPDRQRMALVLRFYEDLPEAEVARLLDCRPGTVKSLVHRGLARVRKETQR